jgi:hypothetical protein
METLHRQFGSQTIVQDCADSPVYTVASPYFPFTFRRSLVYKAWRTAHRGDCGPASGTPIRWFCLAPQRPEAADNAQIPKSISQAGRHGRRHEFKFGKNK